MNRFERLFVGKYYWMPGFSSVRFFAEGADGTGEAGGGAGADQGAKHWLDSSPDFAPLAKDADARKALADYKTPADAHKALVEAKRQIRTTFRVPDSLEGLEPDEVAKVTKRLKGILKPEHVRALTGAPTKPEEYKLDKPRMPEGCTADETVEKSIREYGVKHGLSQEAVAELHTMIHGRDAQRFTTEVEDNLAIGKEANAACEKRYGKEEWARLRKQSADLLSEYGAKADKRYTEILADILDTKNAGKVEALMVAIAELAVAAGSGVTKLGLRTSSGEKIDIGQRWPHSADVMGA